MGIEEKGEQAAGRERFRDSEGVGLRANSPLRRGPGQFDRTPDAFALSARKIASGKRDFAPAPLKLFGVAFAKPLF